MSVLGLSTCVEKVHWRGQGGRIAFVASPDPIVAPRLAWVGRQVVDLWCRRVGMHLAGQLRSTGRTLTESARLAKLDVVACLANVLARVASRPASRNDELLPQK